MTTVGELLRSAARLPQESARRDVEILLGHCLGRTRSWLYTWPEREVTAPEAERFNALLSRRLQGQPVAYLVGEREFWSLRLAVDSNTLIPRPETESLIEWVLELALPRDARVLDLGTGSGAIALALASERAAWRIMAVDRCVDALAVAARNCSRHALTNVTFLHSDWYAGLGDGRFDLIVANPPYIEPGDPHLQRGDLRFEPRAALVAAEQGLADLRRIVAGAPARLAPGGWLLLEHGSGQGPAVRVMLERAGLRRVGSRRDLAGQERVSAGCQYADG